MHLQWRAVIALLVAHCVQCERGDRELVGQWAVGLRGDGSTPQELEERAQNIAKQHGLIFKGPVSTYYTRLGVCCTIIDYSGIYMCCR